MKRATPNQIRRLFPNASKSTLEANIDADCGAPDTDAQPMLRDGPLAAPKAKDRHPGKHVVRITSFRVRLADVDALCGKWHLDSLRYSGILFDDTEAEVDYQICQKKVATKAAQKTVIEITFP